MLVIALVTCFVTCDGRSGVTRRLDLVDGSVMESDLDHRLLVAGGGEFEEPYSEVRSAGRLLTLIAGRGYTLQDHQFCTRPTEDVTSMA